MNPLDVDKLLKELTLEEKSSLCSGADFWHTEAIERLGIPSVMVADGPHGLRKQDDLVDHLGVAESVKAVCFPTASALACSFDRDLIYEIGCALGEECQAEQVAVLLGPGANMKRSPLCGRNFEYYSEDPFLTGEMGAAFVNGVQSRNIGTSLKHFAVNNQEWRRMSTSAEVDERTLREIYLSAFEQIVKEAQPWTIMCSYNRINGIYSCENEWLLNQVLRKEWGFKGLLLTDWGAMNQRIPSLEAGMDLEMPSSHKETDKQITEAVNDGTLSMSILDQSVRRILELINKYLSQKKENAFYNKEEHHNLAKKAALNCGVLLKNNSLLPLKPEQKISIIGKFAKHPRIQGGGSSHINCFRVDSALDAFTQFPDITTTYAQGYDTDADLINKDLEAQAIASAKESDVAVIFVGLPDSFESEGFDRTHMNLPDCQNHLITEICNVQSNTVVVLHNGSPVLMPWLDQVSSVLEMYLAGQTSGAAAVELLYGRANPSGKLAETFPLHLEDNPSYLNFPGTRNKVCYQEGVYIGYRYYDKKKMNVLFPFGHGLSYTTFRYSNMKVIINDIPADSNAPEVKDTDCIQIQLDVTNTGNCPGAEVVQLYVRNSICEETRPEQELKNFAKVMLLPDETKTVTMELNQRSFAYYHTGIHNWYVPSGEYRILAGSSSREIHCDTTLSVKGTVKIPFTATDITTCQDVTLFAPDSAPLDAMLAKSGFTQKDKEDSDAMGTSTTEFMKAMFAETPLHSILSFSDEELMIEDIQKTIDALNRQ